MAGARARYSLARLLAAQAGPIRRHPDFPKLEGLLRESAALRKVRLSRIAYRLLDEPRLELRNLVNFHSTYRVPASPFFSLFLSMKWDRRRSQAAAREERARQIAEIMAACPTEVLGLLRYLAEAERTRNPAAPVWEGSYRPKTKKRAREMAALTLDEWLPLLSGYVDELRGRYRRLELAATDRLLAYALLACLPDPATGKLPTDAAVRARYRESSKACHPDLGGDGRRFLLVTRARDLILGRGRALR
jgi:hypothetical protein